MYTVYYAEFDNPDEVRVGTVSAPNKSVAHSNARMQFANSTIQKVLEIASFEQKKELPGARFINGEFLPVTHNDDLM